MRRGARDFIQKPWDNARLLAIVRTQVELGRRPAPRPAPRGGDSGCCATRARSSSSPSRRPCSRCCDMIARVGPSDANVLITGENGTGKGTVAAGPARRVAPGQPAARHRQRGRPVRGRLRERALRPREGRLHRRQDRPRRPLRDGRRRHPLPRRDRERAHEPAAQAAARAGDRRVRAGGLLEDAQGRRAHPLRHQRRPSAPRWPRAASARTCSSASTPSRSTCRPCASGARTSRRWPATSCGSTRTRYRKRLTGFDAAALRALTEHSLAGQRARARPRGRARGADDPGPRDQGRRSGPQPSGDAPEPPRRDEPRGGRAFLIKKALARFDGNVSRAADALGLSRSALYRRLQRYGL